MQTNQLIARLGNLSAADIKRLDDESSNVRLEEKEPGRWHMGASIIGHECPRFLWYSFRWAKRETVSGQMRRLWERGHLEEPRFLLSLEAIGIKTMAVDNNGKQFKFSTLEGHFGGSCDGFGFLPQLRFGLEFKTHNEKSFEKLKKEGVLRSKPRHFEQMTLYGVYFDTPQALYGAVNKNNDERYWEIVDTSNVKVAKELTAKAEYVITSQTPPPRIAAQSTYSTCKRCSMAGPCWFSEPFIKNCRSCRFARPAVNAQWFCDHWQGIIPRTTVINGCDHWQENR